jgi:hypothetical protein
MLLVFESTPTSKDINSPSTVTKGTRWNRHLCIYLFVCVSLREQKTKQKAPKSKGTQKRSQKPETNKRKKVKES